MRACDQSSIFSTGGKFHPDCGLLLELHAFTLVAHSYTLLNKVEDTKVKMVSCYYQLVSVIGQYTTDAVICVLDHNQTELGTGQGGYAFVLLVLLLVTLMIAKVIGLSECCFLDTTFEYLAVYYSCGQAT